MSRYLVATAACSDCGYECPADWGNHLGACVDHPPLNTPQAVAQRIIRDYAERVPILSFNMLREKFDSEAIPKTLRGPAMTGAVDRGVLAKAGHVPSAGGSAKGAELKTYRSLVFKGAAA
jgi:hypothetical protein